MMASKKPDPPTISSKEVEYEITSLAVSDDEKNILKDFLVQVSITIAPQSSVSHQKHVKNLSSPSEVTNADMDGEGERTDGDTSSDAIEGWLPPSGKTKVQNPSSLQQPGPVSRRRKPTNAEQAIIECTLRGIPLT